MHHPWFKPHSNKLTNPKPKRETPLMLVCSCGTIAIEDNSPVDSYNNDPNPNPTPNHWQDRLRHWIPSTNTNTAPANEIKFTEGSGSTMAQSLYSSLQPRPCPHQATIEAANARMKGKSKLQTDSDVANSSSSPVLETPKKVMKMAGAGAGAGGDEKTTPQRHEDSSREAAAHVSHKRLQPRPQPHSFPNPLYQSEIYGQQYGQYVGGGGGAATATTFPQTQPSPLFGSFYGVDLLQQQLLLNNGLNSWIGGGGPNGNTVPLATIAKDRLAIFEQDFGRGLDSAPGGYPRRKETFGGRVVKEEHRNDWDKLEAFVARDYFYERYNMWPWSPAPSPVSVAAFSPEQERASSWSSSFQQGRTSPWSPFKSVDILTAALEAIKLPKERESSTNVFCTTPEAVRNMYADNSPSVESFRIGTVRRFTPMSTSFTSLRPVPTPTFVDKESQVEEDLIQPEVKILCDRAVGDSSIYISSYTCICGREYSGSVSLLSQAKQASMPLASSLPRGQVHLKKPAYSSHVAPKISSILTPSLHSHEVFPPLPGGNQEIVTPAAVRSASGSWLNLSSPSKPPVPASARIPSLMDLKLSPSQAMIRKRGNKPNQHPTLADYLPHSIKRKTGKSRGVSLDGKSLKRNNEPLLVQPPDPADTQDTQEDDSLSEFHDLLQAMNISSQSISGRGDSFYETTDDGDLDIETNHLRESLSSSSTQSSVDLSFPSSFEPERPGCSHAESQSTIIQEIGRTPLPRRTRKRRHQLVVFFKDLNETSAMLQRTKISEGQGLMTPLCPSICFTPQMSEDTQIDLRRVPT